MCVANVVNAQEKNRLTLTFPALAMSQDVLFLIKGANKAEVLKEVTVDGLHPAAQVRGQNSTLFFLDEDAAAQLPPDES